MPESRAPLDREQIIIEHGLEAEHWWFVNKRRIVLRLLGQAVRPPGRLLDVGCGGSFLAALLMRSGWTVAAADLSPDALAFAAEQGIPETHRFDAGERWPLPDSTVDAIVMTDVLEHIDDDALALAEARRVLAPGGAVVATVPAHTFLFSARDRLLGHFRRYSRKGFCEVAGRAGLRVERLTWWNAISFPPSFIVRTRWRWPPAGYRRADLMRAPRLLNGILKAWGCVESGWLSVAGIPFGISLAAVLRKE
jgi:SAM-dependent methyltransferase